MEGGEFFAEGWHLAPTILQHQILQLQLCLLMPFCILLGVKTFPKPLSLSACTVQPNNVDLKPSFWVFPVLFGEYSSISFSHSSKEKRGKDREDDIASAFIG